MAKITSRASLNVGTELTVNTSTLKITLNVAGNLVASDGVSWQALYSKMIDLWTTSTYQDFPFPFYTIDVLSGQFNIGFDGSLYNGWQFADAPSRGYLRDGGWNEYSSAGVLARVYAGVVTLGSISSGSQLYYQTTATGSPTNFIYQNAANQGVQVYGDATADSTTTTFDTRTFLKGFTREQGKPFQDSVLADTGKTGTGAYLVNLLLSNTGSENNITAADGSISSAPYSSINVKYFPSAFQCDVDTVGSPRSFGIVIDAGTWSGVDGSNSAGGSVLNTAAAGITGSSYTGGTLSVLSGPNKGTYIISGTPTTTAVTITGNLASAQTGQSFVLNPATPLGATLPQIYTKIQYLLRQNSNINGLASAGSVTGKTAVLLLNFTSSLNAGFYAPTNPNGGGTGVIINGYNQADINSFVAYDNSAVARSFPYLSVGQILSSATLTAGGTGYYRMYYTTNPAGNYGSSSAVTVNDANGNPIAGTISGSSTSFSFSYTTNVQGGRTASTDAAVTLVAGNPGHGKPVVATGTLTASKAISLSLVAETDRAYV